MLPDLISGARLIQKNHQGVDDFFRQIRMQRVGNRIDEHAKGPGPGAQQRVLLNEVSQHADAGDLQTVILMVREGHQLTDQKLREVLRRDLDPAADETEALLLVVAQRR